MKKKIYRVRTQYIFDGVFDVVADSKEKARQKVLQNCGLVMSRFSNNLSNELLVAYSKLDDVRASTSDEFPFIDILKDGQAYLSLGYELLHGTMPYTTMYGMPKTN